MDHMIDVVAENGIPFRAVVNKKVDREAIIHFYDRRYHHTENGQFTGASYYVSTFLEASEGGLSLYGGVADWTLDAVTFRMVRNWVRFLGDKGLLGIDTSEL